MTPEASIGYHKVRGKGVVVLGGDLKPLEL